MEKLNLKTDVVMLMVYIKKTHEMCSTFQGQHLEIKDGAYHSRHILTEQFNSLLKF